MVEEALEDTIIKLSPRRSSNYWEVIFEGSKAQSLRHVKFSNESKAGFKDALILGSDIRNTPDANAMIIIRDMVFDYCDFDGLFESDIITFDSCKFIRCDFGLTTWRRVKFNNCEFKNTSISLARFIDCSFRSCKWNNISAGSETVFESTYINNSEILIESIYTNINQSTLTKYNRTIDYQKERLAQSKHHLARRLFESSKCLIEDVYYYRIVKCLSESGYGLKISVAVREAKREKRILCKIAKYFSAFTIFVEMRAMMLCAYFNDWGRSVSKPAFWVLGTILVFSAVYLVCSWVQGPEAGGAFWAVDFGWSAVWLALRKSVEITLLFGYTAYTSDADRYVGCFNAFHVINAVLGLWWYSVFASTIMSKMSKSR